ncbi:unnamed protein product [Eretmochelys imbricata]
MGNSWITENQGWNREMGTAQREEKERSIYHHSPSLSVYLSIPTHPSLSLYPHPPLSLSLSCLPQRLDEEEEEKSPEEDLNPPIGPATWTQRVSSFLRTPSFTSHPGPGPEEIGKSRDSPWKGKHEIPPAPFGVSDLGDLRVHVNDL